MATNAEDIHESGSEQARLDERMAALIGRLEKDSEDRVTRRDALEQRWLEDLSQYHGKYEEKVINDLKESKKSTIFINSTRPKTNAMEARLSDMLFPTDDRNWGVQPTPVPEVTVGAEEAARAVADAKQAAVASPDDQQMQQAAQSAEQQLAMLDATQTEAKKRARAMEEEIDDKLRECNYSSQCREVIRDGCKIGTGVLKGPITDGRTRSSWQMSERADDGTGGAYELTNEQDPKPVFWRVDPWNFFPDMDATSMEDGEGAYERHLLNGKQLRRLARLPGFDDDALRQLLLDGPQSTIPTYISDLRSITGSYSDFLKDRFHVWEYHGPISAEEMRDLATTTGKQDILDDLGDVDPLDELEVVIWFCQHRVIKFGEHHLDSGESIYSVFNLEKDETSVFGFGIPYIMRDPQKSLAASWRTLMDNMGLSSGPQIVLNDDVIEPVNGEWVLEPRKLWRRKGAAPPDKKPFEIYDIPSHMDELLKVIEVSKQNIDEETALPMLAQGDQASNITKTAGGMSILMNSVNIIFRRIVKNWDDDLTAPSIRRMYDYLMQFSEKEYIKGDLMVDARGTSVLLVKEIQSTNLMTFLMNFSGHPVLGKYLKTEGLPALRRLAQTLLIPADEVVKSDTEVAEAEAKAAESPPPPDPEMEKIAASLNLEQMKGQNNLQLEGMRRETALIKMAGEMNWSVEKLQAELENKKADRDSKERMMAAEAAVTERVGTGGGGHF